MIDASDPRVRARIRYFAQRRVAKRKLRTYVPFITPEYEEPRALEPLCCVLDRIQAGEEVFATCGAPPRHGKTQTVFHGVARYLDAFPKHLVAYCTFSSDIAKDQSRLARDIAARAGVLVTDEQTIAYAWNPAASVRYWQTQQGGGFLSVGRKGAIVGRGPNLLIIDDPFRDRDEAESQAAREDVWDWYAGTLFPRREPGASVLVFHQRWNDDDLIARIVDRSQKAGREHGADWEHITLSAIRDDGTPLWPERYDLSALELIRAEVEEYNWWSQYMQKPRPKGGRLFSEPARLHAPPERRMRVIISVDPAGTEKTSADHTAIVIGLTWKHVFEGRAYTFVYVRRVIRKQLEVPETVVLLRELGRDFPGAPIVIETQGGHGAAVAQSLRRIDDQLDIHEITTTSQKYTRWQPTVAAWNRSRILVPMLEHEGDPPWIADYLGEMKRVTGVGDREDDQADATSQLYDYADLMSFDDEGYVGEEREAADTGGY